MVTGEDILQSNFDIYGDERFDNLKYQIVNLLEAESIEVSERHMQKVVHLDAAAARTNKGVRVAVVARKEDAAKLQELYEKYSKGEELGLEEKVGEKDLYRAMAWLLDRQDKIERRLAKNI